MCSHEFVIDMFIFPCNDKKSKERIIKDLTDGVKRPDSIKFIDEQYAQYLHTMSILGDERDFYREIKVADFGKKKKVFNG